MNRHLIAKYHKLIIAKNKTSILEKHFHAFLPEAIYRTTKIEHPEITKKQIIGYLQ